MLALITDLFPEVQKFCMYIFIHIYNLPSLKTNKEKSQLFPQLPLQSDLGSLLLLQANSVLLSFWRKNVVFVFNFLLYFSG